MPMNDLLNTLASEQTKADLPEVRPGDTVRVSVRVVEGNRERVQNFEGTVLRVRNGGLDKQITVRRISSGVGVERTFLMHSPRVEKIELVRHGHARRAPLSRIRGRVVKVGIGAASVAEIHRLNIYHASHVAMLRALRQIGEYDWVLVDGRRILDPAFAPGRHTEIVRGDAKSFAIAAASIVAKVTRDRLMAKLATKYPGYGWEHNCGYPTIDHRKALRELGVTPFHRQDFGTVRMMLSTEQQIPLELEAAGVSPS